MSPQRQRPAGPPPAVRLLGGFGLAVRGQPTTLQIHAQRLLAYLALAQPTHVDHLRTVVAERLWGDVTVERSHASLRTALWRIRRADPHLVHASRDTVRLNEEVEVDVRCCLSQSSRLLALHIELQPGDTDLGNLRGELLAGWDEEWLLLERERIRQVQIHALEALAGRLRRLGRHPEAIEAAFAAIAAEPLRESAHAALIEVFLAERNLAQARRHLDRYAVLLWSELRIKPSAALTNRVAGAACAFAHG
jgi:DNA-binding SARP family transcriptional activator